MTFSGNLKMLHFDANPIRMEYLVTELWAIYQRWKQYKIKEFELFLCQYLNKIYLRHPTHSLWSCHIFMITFFTDCFNSNCKVVKLGPPQPHMLSLPPAILAGKDVFHFILFFCTCHYNVCNISVFSVCLVLFYTDDTDV